MEVLETRVYRGPNIYGYSPMIRMTLDLEELEEYPSDKLPGFTDQLMAALPTLFDHGCSYGEPGGFLARLREGTWMGHIVEHIALELQCLAGTEVSRGKTRSVPNQPGVYYVVYSYTEEELGLRAGALALRLARSLLPAHLPSALPESERAAFVFADERDALIVWAQDRVLGPTTASLVREARRRDIPAIRLDNDSLVQLGYGKYQQRIRASVTSRTSTIAVETASDKALTITLLDEIGIPTPRHRLVCSADEAQAAAEALGFPLVIKPLDVSHGRGISLNLSSLEAVRKAYEIASAYNDEILVEQFLPGKDYRVLVVNHKVVAVAERVPAHVVGDGQRTIAELIDTVNSDPRRGIGHEKVLTRIRITHQSEDLLAKAGYTLATVLAAGEVFYLASTANLSTGGTSIDRTNDIHYENRELARRAAMVIGLDIAGIDMVTPDISQPMREVGGGIVEVNAGPGFRMHLQPGEGQPRNVARPVISMLFPPSRHARIPLVAITGTNGKTTVARMVAHMLKMHGERVGLTTTDGIYIDGQIYMRGDLTGPWSARMVLKDPTVDAAVLETARGGIIREGLGFDTCDVGAVLNVSADHLGLGGIDTLEQLADVKSLVVEVVHKHGTSVLNADDPLVAAMAKRAGGRIIYWSLKGGDDASPLVKEHIAQGGVTVVVQTGVRGEMIAIYDEEQYIPLLWTHLIPATLEGKARHNVANALAATGIAYARGVSIEDIKQGLRTFNSTFYQSPGRLNVFDEHPFRVLMDYGHNPAAFAAMHELIGQLRPSHERVLGVLGVPGDRRDEDIRASGNEAGSGMFDVLIVREDNDRRGRPVDEAATLLRESALAAGMPADHIHTVLNEREAVLHGLSLAQPGDLLVIFADQVTAMWKEVIYYGKPADDT